MLDTLNLFLSITLFCLILFYFRLDKKSSNIKKRVDTISDRELDLRIIRLEEGFSSLSKQLQDIRTQVDSLNLNTKDLKNRIERVERDSERAYYVVDQVQEKVSELTVSIQNLSNRSYD